MYVDDSGPECRATTMSCAKLTGWFSLEYQANCWSLILFSKLPSCFYINIIRINHKNWVNNFFVTNSKDNKKTKKFKILNR